MPYMESSCKIPLGILIMLFISLYEVRELLHKEMGSIEVECTVDPQVKMNAVVGIWHVYFAPNEGGPRVPIITSGKNPKIRVLKRLHGIFILLHQLGISPILIPNVAGETTKMRLPKSSNVDKF